MNDEHDTETGIGPILLRDGLILGRGAEAAALLPDGAVSRRHAQIHRSGDGWMIEDLASRSGSFLNGRLFQREQLVHGDIIRIGPFCLRFDGQRLTGAMGFHGAQLDARGLGKIASGVAILSDVSLAVAPGQFVGMIGPSGAGKSTLLDALCGLRPAGSGEVKVDGVELYANYENLREQLGYVPQDDIVPLELSVQDALHFSARMRLPRGTPPSEIRRVVTHTIHRIGLGPRAGTRVGQLSGGQRKRVSVAAELICRPRLMFLDEPTSGLDPAAEFRLMESLRDLATNGCTIVCTTHVMGNAYLFDRLAVMHGGRLVFFGEPAAALLQFGVDHLANLYDRLEEKPAGDWPVHVESSAAPLPVPLPPRQRRSAALPILLQRQWAILRADWKNLLLALAQPVFIGLLVTWVSRDASLVLFFAYIATLWFGCGNAAQEIVRELPMFRRERLIGLARNEYLLAKFLSLTRITIVQCLLLYLVMQIAGGGIEGSWAWQTAALVLTACAAVSIGLAISAWSKTVLQAVMLVPLVLIPQILFSGFTPPAGDMKAGPYAVSRVMPSAAAQSAMDVSLLWGKTISPFVRADYPSAFSNLNRDHSLRNGLVYRNGGPGRWGLLALTAWTIAAYAGAWFGLRGKERG